MDLKGTMGRMAVFNIQRIAWPVLFGGSPNKGLSHMIEPSLVCQSYQALGGMLAHCILLRFSKIKVWPLGAD